MGHTLGYYRGYPAVSHIVDLPHSERFPRRKVGQTQEVFPVRE